MTRTNQPRFRDYIVGRIKKNKNFIGIFTGATGSGKSYGSLSLAEQICEAQGRKFDIKYCVFTPKEFLEVLNSKDIQKGDVVVWEEIGIGMSSRNWQKVTNKLINFLMQSFRNLNLVVLLNCPDFSFLDIQVRKLVHTVFETQGIDMKRKELNVKPLMLQVNQRSGKIYAKYLRVVTPRGLAPFTTLVLPKPREELVKQYEDKKSKFVEELKSSILQEINSTEKKKVIKYGCDSCDHKWVTRGKNTPKQCPKCRRTTIVQL